MPAARYWRFTRLSSWGLGDVELTELALYESGVRVDTGAAITSTVTPASGSLAALNDASGSASVRWALADYDSLAFAIVYDLGTAKDVNEIRPGKASTKELTLFGLYIEYSTDGTAWVKRGYYEGFDFATATYEMPLVMCNDPDADLVLLQIAFDGPITGSTSQRPIDHQSRFEHTVEVRGITGVQSSVKKFGVGSVFLNGSSDGVFVSYSGVMPHANNGDFCFNMEVRCTNPGATKAGLFDMRTGRFIRLWIDANALVLNDGYSDVNIVSSAALTWDTGQFYQITVERYNGVVKIFRDGVVVASATWTNDMWKDSSYPTVALWIGYSPYDGYSNSFQGYIDNFWFKAAAPHKGLPFTRDTAPVEPWPTALLKGSALRRVQARAVTPTRVNLELPTDVSFPLQKPITTKQRQDFCGNGRIVGTTKEKGTPNVPLRRRVFCLDAETATCVADTWSDATTGAYVFNDLDMNRKYTVFSYDHTGAYRGVIADNLTPEAMP